MAREGPNLLAKNREVHHNTIDSHVKKLRQKFTARNDDPSKRCVALTMGSNGRMERTGTSCLASRFMGKIEVAATRYLPGCANARLIEESVVINSRYSIEPSPSVEVPVLTARTCTEGFDMNHAIHF